MVPAAAGIAGQMAVVSLPIVLGYALNRLDILGGDFDRRLTLLVLNVTLPCTIVSAVTSVDELPSHGAVLLTVGLMVAAMLVSWVIAIVMPRLLRVPRAMEGAYRFAIMFGNAGFIGFPVISSILGHEALLYAVIASIPGNVFMFTVGAVMFASPRGCGGAGGDGEVGAGRRRVPDWLSPSRRLRRALSGMVTPTMLASLLALALVLAGVRDLGLVGQSLSVVGQVSTPCALLITGSSLAAYDPLRMLANARAYVAAACRLVVVPCLCFSVLAAAGFSGLPAMVVALECAMPVATNGMLYCVQSGMDPEAMMQVTFLSVVGSIASIPLVCALLG